MRSSIPPSTPPRSKPPTIAPIATPSSCACSKVELPASPRWSGRTTRSCSSTRTGRWCARFARSTISGRAPPGRRSPIATSCAVTPRGPDSLLAQSALELIPLRGGLGAVPGVRLAGVHAGIKPRKRDLALIAFETPQNCASVITTNEIKAAPLLVSAEHLAHSPAMRALVCNSGCANACTGERGERDARATARQAAALLGIASTEVVIASTGVIGVPLAVDRVQRGLERAAAQLDSGGKAAFDAAEAIMTTDRVPKLAAYAFYHDDRKYVVGGIAKGSGMIAPDMATMLAFIATDYPLSAGALAALLRASCDESFNMISVDGD